MINFNIDFAVECVKSISDNTQCITCDKLIGPCVRFPCGHSICEGCALRTGECLFCVSSPTSYLIDKPQTARLNNAYALLTAFQDTFKIDVYERQRISDQLKVEKLVFPECIQAPHKYSNKRKSLDNSVKNKENIRPKIFPGEEIKGSDTIIMKKSVQYVQNWLNQHDSIPQNLPRRPFGDININSQSLVQNTKQDIVNLKNVTGHGYARQSTCRKRTHFNSIKKTSKLNKMVKNSQRHLEIKKQDNNYKDTHVLHKCDTNESGIVLEDDPIVIEDIDIIDKDQQAWLAVLDAAENEDKINEKNKLKTETYTNNSLVDNHIKAGSIFVDSSSRSEKNGSRFQNNVLFYKKSTLFETCTLCNYHYKTKLNSSLKLNEPNDVSIVINNSSFITTIKFAHIEENKQRVINKTSTAIQTDKSILPTHELINFEGHTSPPKRKNVINNNTVPTKIMKTDGIPQSLAVFPKDNNVKQNISDNSLKQRKSLIIEDSDTDSNVTCDNTQEVIVEVHRSNAPESVECGILKTLSKLEYEQKTKRRIRRQSPNSSNSSDKENVDPNRQKAVKLGKKHKNKK